MLTTRFAPSPTGFLHVGGVRTALFAYLLARSEGGRFLLRIEDTDQSRSQKGYADQIVQALDWLGLEFDGLVIYQSEHVARHQAIAQQLLQQGAAYYCYATEGELGKMRADCKKRGEKFRYDVRWRNATSKIPNTEPVLRFKVSDQGCVQFSDGVFGEVSSVYEQIEDFALLRSDGSPTYHLGCVVDDHDMGVNHVIRGDDHLTNAFKHILLAQALGWSLPNYTHLPMILDQDGKRLSKRNGAADVLGYKQAGYLPQAVLNYLVRLGWSHGDQEVFSMDQMVQCFSIDQVGRSPARFDVGKLAWLNQQYLQTLSADHLLRYLSDLLFCNYSKIKYAQRLVELIRDRSKSLYEVADFLAVFFDDYVVSYDAKACQKWVGDNTGLILNEVLVSLKGLKVWSVESVKGCFDELVSRHQCKFPQLAQPLRLAVFGHTRSPSIDQIVIYLGYEGLEKRVCCFLDYLHKTKVF